MGLPTGAEGRDSSKGEDSAEETEAKPAVMAPPPVVEAASTPTAAFTADPTTEVSPWWELDSPTGSTGSLCPVNLDGC